MSGLIAGQSMASTSCWTKNATMSSATCGEALYSQTQSSDRASLSPMVAYGPPESGCIDACASSYPGWPGYSSHTWWIAPRTITVGLRFPWVSSWMQASISLSLCLWHTWALPSLWYRANLDWSLKMQCLQWRRSHTTAPLVPLTTTSKLWVICIPRQGAEMKWSILTIRSKSFTRSIAFFSLPPSFLWSCRPCCLSRCRTLLMHPCTTHRSLPHYIHRELTCVNKTIFRETC